VDFVRHGRDKGFEEVRRGVPGCFLMQLGEGELRGAIDGHEEMEFAFLCPDLGNVDMKIANRGTP
jgi:hypothetical protein